MSVGDARPVQPGGWYGRTAGALRRPWAQALTGLALIGLLALLYLNQVASVAVANARLGNLRAVAAVILALDGPPRSGGRP